MNNASIFDIYYKDFPLAFRFGSYTALLRPMGMKVLVEQLYDSSRLTHQTYQRLQTTRRLIKSLIRCGVNSDEGGAVIAHMNQAHAHLPNDNDAFRYVLCCFFLEPFRWNQCFDKQLIPTEKKQKIIDFWCEIGKAMGITSLCDNERDWLVFQQQYEARYTGFSEQGHALAMQAINETPKLAFPLGARYLLRQYLLATMDQDIRLMLRLPKAGLSSGVLVWAMTPLGWLASPS